MKYKRNILSVSVATLVVFSLCAVSASTSVSAATSSSAVASWSPWVSMGGSLTSSPAVAVSASDRLDVFARGSNGALYHRWYMGDWSPWASLGGQLAPGTGPAACWGPTGWLDVFVVGTNNALYHANYQE